MNIEKGKKYVAMVVDRHYIGPDTFIFSCNHAMIGEIDPKTGEFTDRTGNKYYPIISEQSIKSEVPYAYNGVCELNKLKELHDAPSIKDSLKDYEEKYKKVVYFVSKTENGEHYLVTQPIEEWYDKAFNQLQNNEIEIGDLQEDRDEIGTEYENLIIDIINKKYSNKELKRIRKELIEHQEWIESSIETVDLQMEAMEQKENFTDYVDKKKSKEQENQKKIEEKVVKEKVVEEKEEPKKNKEIRIDEVYNKVIKTLIAQDEPARRVITEISRKEEAEEEGEKSSGILITGQSGSGKTLLMKLIAENINRPFMKVDATKLTMPGYVGKDIEEVLWDLYVECGRNVDVAEQAIIFFDEIDKKGSEKKSDVSGKGVLNVLLPFIEGSEYDACADIKNSSTKIKINTSNMTVILGGAFTDVYKKLIQKNDIGFGGNIYDKTTYREATEEDFINLAGMTDEFMGRLSIVKLNDLDLEAIKRILLESDKSKIKVQERIFEKLGTKITFTDDCITKIAERAIEKKTGARGLNKVILDATWKAYDEVHEHQGEYKEVIITEETIDDPSNFQLIKRRGRKKKNN